MYKPEMALDDHLSESELQKRASYSLNDYYEHRDRPLSVAMAREAHPKTLPKSAYLTIDAERRKTLIKTTYDESSHELYIHIPNFYVGFDGTDFTDGSGRRWRQIEFIQRYPRGIARDAPWEFVLEDSHRKTRLALSTNIFRANTLYYRYDKERSMGILRGGVQYAFLFPRANDYCAQFEPVTNVVSIVLGVMIVVGSLLWLK